MLSIILTNFSDPFMDTLLRLPHAGLDAEWEEIPQKLKVGRHNHIAFMVPDEITNCSINF
jgi:hypothetical protein